MKLSFSTRGWADHSWDELVSTALEMDFSGIEIHNPITNAAFTGKGGPLDRYNTQATARALRDKGLSIPAFDSSVDISAGEQQVQDAKDLIDLAQAASVGMVCVVVQHDDEDAIHAALSQLVPYAEEHGVVLLIESSGIFSSTSRLTDIMDRYASDYLGALWDVHNVYRVGGESPATTIKNLGAYVKHVHMRDSDDDGSFNLVGEGTLPIDEVVRALSSIDYDGFVSLEWDPAWMADLTDMEVIFPHYVNYMEQFEDTRGKRRTLYLNHDGTGEYVWKKDELIDLTFPQVLDKMVECFPDQYCFKYTTLDYTRTYEEFRDDVDTFARALVVDGRQARQQGGHLGHQRTRLVHHLLGRHEDRRRVGHGEHRLQDPRGRVPAAPVRHAHASHDRQLRLTPTTARSSTTCAPRSPTPSPATSCTASAFPSCATSSPSASRCPAA